MGAHRHNPFARGTTVIRQTRLRDIEGRELLSGDLVMIPQPVVMTYMVGDIVANLQPNAPPNSLRVMLHATQMLIVPADQAIRDLVLVRLAREASVNGEGAPDGQPQGGETGKLVVEE